LLDSLLQESYRQFFKKGRQTNRQTRPVFRAKMREGVLTLLAVCVAVAEAAARDTNCDQGQKVEELKACALEATAEYTATFANGDDGRPDWEARKSCNYMTASIEGCFNKLQGCMTEERINAYKDLQFKNTLENVKGNVPNWDSDKCPAAKTYLARLAAAEAEAKNQEETENQPEPTSSAPFVTASILSTLVVAHFILAWIL